MSERLLMYLAQLRRSAAVIAIVTSMASMASMAGSVSAQEAPTSSTPAATSAPGQDAPPLNLPVSIDRIRKALEQKPLKPLKPLFGLHETPTFRIEVQEHNRLQELMSTLDFRSGPVPAGGLYAAEMQRVMFPTSSHPLQQPLAAFNQPELLTILIQTIAGTYLFAGRAADAITNADRAAAEAAAREELRRTILLYCAAQPNGGAGISICTRPPE